MLLPYTTLTYYGPAAGASVASGGADVTIAVKGTARASSVVSGTGLVLRLKGTRLRSQPLITSGIGALVNAAPKLSAKPSMVVRLGTLSQDDVTGAVLEAPVEGDVTVKQALRLLLAYVAGDASGLDSAPAFKSLDGLKTRIGGSVVGGTRTVTTVDPS